MLHKSAASERPVPAKTEKPAFLFGHTAKVELDMGEASRLQGFKLNGSR